MTTETVNNRLSPCSKIQVPPCQVKICGWNFKWCSPKCLTRSSWISIGIQTYWLIYTAVFVKTKHSTFYNIFCTALFFWNISYKGKALQELHYPFRLSPFFPFVLSFLILDRVVAYFLSNYNLYPYITITPIRQLIKTLLKFMLYLMKWRGLIRID